MAATLATLFLFLSPRVAGDAMANVKDFSEMAFFSLAAISLFEAVERASIRGIVLSGLLWGLALGTKANALFLPAIFILYLLWRGVPQRRRAIAVALAGATLRSNLIYLLARKGGTHPENTAGPFAMILFTTPPAFLIAFAAGVIPFARRMRGPSTSAGGSRLSVL